MTPHGSKGEKRDEAAVMIGEIATGEIEKTAQGAIRACEHIQEPGQQLTIVEFAS